MKLVSLMACALTGIVFSTCAAAQTVNSKDCLAYQLLSTQPDSIIVKFNAKIIKLLVTPETEIWRRGVDLSSPLELSTDDDIYVKCADKPAPDDTPIATIIAAAHRDTGVSLEPHHIAEIGACLGRLIDIGAYTLTVKNDDGLCSFLVLPGIDIWRGEVFHETSVLKIGDEVGARVTISYPSGQLVAEDVEANVTVTEGTIASAQPDRIVVNQYPGADRHSAYARGQVTVLLDNRTNFDDCAPRDLRKGASVRALGLQLTPAEFRATYLTVYK